MAEVKIQRALLWDVDGVLVDSEPLHVAKLKKVCKRHKIDLEDAHMATRQNFRIPDRKGGMKDVEMQLGGAGDKNIYWWAYSQHLQNAGLSETCMPPKSYGFISQEQWLAELLSFYLENANNENSPYRIKPRENMPEMVDALHKDGTHQAVVTSGIPRQVETNLMVLGRNASGEERSRAFAFVLDADSVTLSKPNPEGYQTALRRLTTITDAEALAVVAVEDSKPGVIAALKAGACCVHFLLPKQTPMSTEDFEASGLDADAVARYRYAQTGKEVEQAVQKLFVAMEKQEGLAPLTRKEIQPGAPRQSAKLEI
ncbi:MAG: HAD family phosphatase [Alphaproteobacteria bacterium]|nr:HAD family phosphatase [Alphaproteobacteria bacterium]